MTRHDTVKYEADSCALLLEGLQYFAKKHGETSKSEILFAKPFELGNPLTLTGLMMTISFNVAVLPGNCKLTPGWHTLKL